MPLEATLDVTVDGDVRFTFRVENAGDEPVELTFTSGKTADVLVYERTAAGTAGTDGGDGPVWQWSDGRFFTQAIERETLGPDEVIDAEFVWDAPDTGEYTATGVLAADRDVEATAQFSV